MHHWSYIRQQARARRREVCEHARQSATHLAGADLIASQLLAHAETMMGIMRVPLSAGDPLLYGAQATLDEGIIYYNAEIDSWLALYYQAHEFAHHWLHAQVSRCSGADVDYTASEDQSQFGVNRIEAYGPQQRREREANVFAREFLLPGDMLRRLVVEEKLNAAQIAARHGVALDFVMHALAHALLLPDAEDANAIDDSPQMVMDDAARNDAKRNFSLDDSQHAAAHSTHTPLLVAAGPGTGKTRALVGRILHLLDAGALPQSILALTFSNKAAAEIVERVQAHAPDHAPHLETGTFHSFGLELLRRYWQEAQLPPRPVVLDPVDALFILERNLSALRLDHYQNVHEPTTHLPEMLAAISRAKDELCAPARYAELAGKMLDAAQESGDRQALRRAERALEVARVYEVYQMHLEREGLLDFGDLVARTVRLLRENEIVRAEVQSRYAHLLIDEYQDVNRACGVLLNLIGKDGAGLWVVGDVRQAVYRWRGAAPAQLRFFRKDFPAGRVLPLKVNYRSLPAVVRIVSALAVGMRVPPGTQHAAEDGAGFAAWSAARGSDKSSDLNGVVRFEISSDLESEGSELARLIKERKAQGTPYRAQAVICRKHSQLAKFAKALEAGNVPTLYLGDIFERTEVRDLLAFVALASEPSGRTLLRVARFPAYNIPLSDVKAFLKAAREAQVPFPDALTLGDAHAKLRGFFTHTSNETDGDKANPNSNLNSNGITRLAHDLKRVAHIESAWKMLAHYLFIHSRYLENVLADTTIAGARARLCIYQLLQFAHTEEKRAIDATNLPDARRALLAYVRRLKSFAEDKQLRQPPVAAESLDAVRLTTVHGAKGLEWDHVYLPHLGKGHFPDRRKPEPCPPPAGMVEAFGQTCDEPDTHLEEEECLFFVALSRARDGVSLSRAEKYGKANSHASEFLESIEDYLPRKANNAPARRAATATVETPDATFLPLRGAKPHFTERQLSNYLKCPRKYLYENVLFLSGRGEEAIYLRFHICVYETLRWLAAEHAAHRISDTQDAALRDAQAYLAHIWSEQDFAAHIYEPLYREQAEMMIERAVKRLAAAATAPAATPLPREWIIQRPHALLTLTLDHIELVEAASGATLLMQHTRTGRPPSKPPDDSLYGLYYALAAEHFPAARPRVQVLYLSTDETIELDLSPRTVATRLKHYDDAIAGIRAGAFPPTPDDHACPRCAHFFTCPKAE